MEIDKKALYNITYGLYVVTSNDGSKDNGCIVNTVVQVADSPLTVSVCIKKKNYTHEIVKNSGIMNVNCLTVNAKFDVFEKFGFVSGRDKDKFAVETLERTENGLIILPANVNTVISLKTEQYIDLGSHGMFICTPTECRLLSSDESMSYNFYQNNVKPKPKEQKTGKKRWVCKVCGYVYEGDELPSDFECPLCGHPASDFELME